MQSNQYLCSILTEVGLSEQIS